VNDLLIQDRDVLQYDSDGCLVLPRQDIGVRGSRISSIRPTDEE
jgi:hypothetical protein